MSWVVSHSVAKGEDPGAKFDEAVEGGGYDVDPAPGVADQIAAARAAVEALLPGLAADLVQVSAGGHARQDDEDDQVSLVSVSISETRG